MFKPIGVGNMRNFTPSFMASAYLIECHVLTLINRMALPNVNVVTLLRIV
jgi:hypothetical protein